MYHNVSHVYPKMYLGLVWDTYEIHKGSRRGCNGDGGALGGVQEGSWGLGGPGGVQETGGPGGSRGRGPGYRPVPLYSGCVWFMQTSTVVQPHVGAAAVKRTQRARTLSGPPSTGAAIAMDGGVADTACYYTGR